MGASQLPTGGAGQAKFHPDWKLLQQKLKLESEESHPVRNCKIKLLACESLNVEPETDREGEIVRGETNKHESCFYKPRQHKKGKLHNKFKHRKKLHTQIHIFTKKTL